MPDFTSFLHKLKSRATSAKNGTKDKTTDANGHSARDEHNHGAEGNVFQVNGESAQGDVQHDDQGDHHHGAEGDAFQVNGHPERSDDDTDEAR